MNVITNLFLKKMKNKRSEFAVHYSYNKCARGLKETVLAYLLFLVIDSLSINADRNRTVLRRSELRSRTALTGEQPDP